VSLATRNLFQQAEASENWSDTILAWVVFLACAVCTAIGIFLSYKFITVNTAVNFWYVGIIITVGMLSLTYGAKWASEESRRRFTPIDLIQFILQGFLWPSAWPSLAAQLGVDTSIEPPKSPETTMHLLETTHHLLLAIINILT